MGIFALAVLLSLFCLIPQQEYLPNRRGSSSTINELLSSNREEPERHSIGKVVKHLNL